MSSRLLLRPLAAAALLALAGCVAEDYGYAGAGAYDGGYYAAPSYSPYYAPAPAYVPSPWFGFGGGGYDRGYRRDWDRRDSGRREQYRGPERHDFGGGRPAAPPPVHVAPPPSPTPPIHRNTAPVVGPRSDGP